MFGKHKGKLWKDLLEFDDGMNWLEWIGGQPPTDPKFIKVNEVRNTAIKREVANKRSPIPESADIGGTVAIMTELATIKAMSKSILDLVSGLADRQNEEV